MLIECIAQLAGIAASHQEGEGGFLAAIDNAVFNGQIQPGDTLEIRTDVIKSFGRLCLVKGEVSCNSIKLVEATMTLGIGTI
jgi:3-hydroxyacyl-[acyl-carrier-protein] dehydratase